MLSGDGRRRTATAVIAGHGKRSGPFGRPDTIVKKQQLKPKGALGNNSI